MNRLKNALPFCLLVVAAAPLCAGPRVSLTYALISDAADSAGGRTTSASYTNDSSVGAVAGISTVPVPSETAKGGYVAQLSEVAELVLSAASPSINEGATDLLAAWQALDDASFLSIPVGNVAWSVAGGPLTGISPAGLATAGTVAQDTTATVRATYLGITGTLVLTVRNVNNDDFGSYAGDGLDDAWQVQYFGQNNPNAAPGMDFSHTGQTNLFKYTAGLNPLDPAARFKLATAQDGGVRKFVFGPVLAGRAYVVTGKPDLGPGPWVPVPGATFTDVGTERTVSIPAAGTTGYFRIEITKP